MGLGACAAPVKNRVPDGWISPEIEPTCLGSPALKRKIYLAQRKALRMLESIYERPLRPVPKICVTTTIPKENISKGPQKLIPMLEQMGAQFNAKPKASRLPFWGVFVPEHNSIYLSKPKKWSEKELRGILVHELTHAYRYQLNGGHQRPEGHYIQNPKVAVWKCLSEGEAELMRTIIVPREGILQPKTPKSMNRRIFTRLVDEHYTRRVEASDKYAPIGLNSYFYSHCPIFIAAAIKQGGLKRVQSLWSHLPQSSEQTIHFHRFLNGHLDLPSILPSPELSALKRLGYVRVLQGDLGEVFLNTVLLSMWKGIGTSFPPVEGWDGLRVARFELEKSPAVTLAVGVWDSKEGMLKLADWWMLRASPSEELQQVIRIEREDVRIFELKAFGRFYIKDNRFLAIFCKDQRTLRELQEEVMSPNSALHSFMAVPSR